MRLIFTIFFIFQIFNFSAPAQKVQETESVKSQIREADFLTLGKSVERQLKGGETRDFLVKAEAGEAVLITVEQRGIDVAVAVYDSARSDEKISETDFSLGVHGTERLFFVAAKTGDYRVEVRSLVKNAKAGRLPDRAFGKASRHSARPARKSCRRTVLCGNIALRKRTAEFYKEALKNFDEAIADLAGNRQRARSRASAVSQS
jgi:hypothetical protein